jgi:lipoyl-dependent peroxiredoxin
MMDRSATILWTGSGNDARGFITTQSRSLLEVPYSYVSRFFLSDGTNPEELLAAAHACCFSIKLNIVLEASGYFPKKISTTASIRFERGMIASSHLRVRANIPGISEKHLDEFVGHAKLNCPICQALKITISTQSILDQTL